MRAIDLDTAHWDSVRELAKIHGVQTGRCSRQDVMDKLRPILEKLEAAPVMWVSYPVGARSGKGKWTAVLNDDLHAVRIRDGNGQIIASIYRLTPSGKLTNYRDLASKFVDMMNSKVGDAGQI